MPSLDPWIALYRDEKDRQRCRPRVVLLPGEWHGGPGSKWSGWWPVGGGKGTARPETHVTPGFAYQIKHTKDT